MSFTVTYKQVRNQAAELAGRTRDKIPSTEATMLLTFFAGNLPKVWAAADWPELCDNLEAIDPDTSDTGRVIDKRIGLANEIGDVLAMLSADPRSTTRYAAVPFQDGDDQVYVLQPISPVYVDWKLPCPFLLDYDTTTVLTVELPRRFLVPLAFLGAAFLMQADNNPSMAGVFLGQAQAEIDRQVGGLQTVAWRNRPTVRGMDGGIA